MKSHGKLAFLKLARIANLGRLGRTDPFKAVRNQRRRSVLHCSFRVGFFESWPDASIACSEDRPIAIDDSPEDVPFEAPLELKRVNFFWLGRSSPDVPPEIFESGWQGRQKQRSKSQLQEFQSLYEAEPLAFDNP